MSIKGREIIRQRHKRQREQVRRVTRGGAEKPLYALAPPSMLNLVDEVNWPSALPLELLRMIDPIAYARHVTIEPFTPGELLRECEILAALEHLHAARAAIDAETGLEGRVLVVLP